jgi:hypothetical protein
MKKLVLVLVLVLLIKPAFGFSYAEELINENETYNSIANMSYESKDYLLYGIYQDSQERLIVIQDSLDVLTTSNKTIRDIFYAYRYNILESSENETVENPKIASEKDFNLLVNRIQEKKSYVENKIKDIENVTPQYQLLILNLSSQGAYASKSIKLFSDMQDLIWQAKMLFYENKFNNADKVLENSKKIAPRITLDVRSSFRVNEGSLALEKALADISDMRKQGYDTKRIEEMFDNTNSLLTEAKNSYISEDYDNIDSKIASVLEAADKISYEIEKLKVIKPQVTQNVTTTQQPTGLLIRDYSWMSYALGIVAIVAIAVFLVYKKRTSKFVYHYKRRRLF